MPIVIRGAHSGLPDDVSSHLSLLPLLTPREKKTSFASSEFDDPVSSALRRRDDPIRLISSFKGY